MLFFATLPYVCRRMSHKRPHTPSGGGKPSHGGAGKLSNAGSFAHGGSKPHQAHKGQQDQNKTQSHGQSHGGNSEGQQSKHTGHNGRNGHNGSKGHKGQGQKRRVPGSGDADEDEDSDDGFEVASARRTHAAVFREQWSLDRGGPGSDTDSDAEDSQDSDTEDSDAAEDDDDTDTEVQNTTKSAAKKPQQQQQQQSQQQRADDSNPNNKKPRLASTAAPAHAAPAATLTTMAPAPALSRQVTSTGAPKLTGWEWFRAMGSPRFVLSPMVGQSELAFRVLCRRHGATLAYTPMIIATRFVESEAYRRAVWQTAPEDRPLVVQFCANDPAVLVAAAKLVQGQCDAVDLNLGCPQEVARRGTYGSYLMEHLDTVKAMVTAAATQLDVPVTVKVRVFPEFARTLAYCRMLQAAGASLITVHGRQRHHREEVLADWSAAARLRTLLRIPVVLNGDLWAPEDVANCLAGARVDGFMSAQGILHNPALFAPLAAVKQRLPFPAPQTGTEQAQLQARRQALLLARSKAGAGAEGPVAVDGGPVAFSWAAPQPDDRLRQRRHISPFFSFALTTVFNHPLSQVRGDGVGSLSGMASGADALDNSNGNGAEAKSATGAEGESAETESAESVLSGKEIRAAFATPFTTPTDARRQFALATEYCDIMKQYPVYHASMARRHIFFMLFDNFQANLDQYDLLCDAANDTAYRGIIATLQARAEAGVNKRAKNAYGGGADGQKPRPRRRDGTVAPPPWPVGGGGMNSEAPKKPGQPGSSLAPAGPGSGPGAKGAKGGAAGPGAVRRNNNSEEDSLTVIGNGMSTASAKALAKAAASGLDPSRLRNINLSKFD